MYTFYSLWQRMSTLRLLGINAKARSGLTLHFDKLSVLSLPKEAALYTLS